MNKNGIVLQKRDINQIINESLFGNFFKDYFNEEDPKEEEVGYLYNSIVKSYKSDKELMYFFSKANITDTETKLDIATCSESVARNCIMLTVDCKDTKYTDFYEWCENMENTLSHREQLQFSNKLLNKFCYGNKYVACNMWKLLTNKNYKQYNTSMPPKIENANSFAGPIGHIGGDYENNECRYTSWFLIWQLAKTNSGVNLIDDNQISDIIYRLETLQKLSDAENKAYAESYRVNSRRKVNERAKRKSNRKNNEAATRYDKIKAIWEKAIKDYTPFFGNSVRKVFILPQSLQLIDQNKNYAASGQGSDYINMEVYGGGDALSNAIEAAQKKYGSGGKKNNFDWLKWAANGLSSIGQALGR